MSPALYITLGFLYFVYISVDVLTESASKCNCKCKLLFNILNAAILLKRLMQSYIHPNVLHILHSFLINRSQKVTSHLNTSGTITTSTGSPQACVNSPLLYSIYVDSLSSSTTPDNIVTLKYTDNTLILEKNPSMSSQLQSVMSTINQWCSESDLLPNKTKIKDIIFSNLHITMQADDRYTCTYVFFVL